MYMHTLGMRQSTLPRLAVDGLSALADIFSFDFVSNIHVEKK